MVSNCTQVSSFIRFLAFSWSKTWLSSFFNLNARFLEQRLSIRRPSGHERRSNTFLWTGAGTPWGGRQRSSSLPPTGTTSGVCSFGSNDAPVRFCRPTWQANGKRNTASPTNWSSVHQRYNIWNALPDNVVSASSVDSSENHQPKTFLFRRSSCCQHTRWICSNLYLHPTTKITG